MLHILSRFLNRSVIARLAFGALCCGLLAGCGGSQQPAKEQAGPRRSPVALLLEREIKGTVMGKSIAAPIGVTVDRRGNIFVVDTGNDRVVMFDSDFSAQRTLGGHGSGPGLFDDPHEIAIDEDLNVWVSDSGNRRLVQYNDRLQYITDIDLYDDEDPLIFGHPGGIATTDFGEIWVADLDNHRIAVLNHLGLIDQIVGDFGYAGGPLRNPSMIMADDDNFYVCDGGNRRIVIYHERGGFMSEIENPVFSEPCSVAIDDQGLLWVLDRQSARIHCFDANQQFLISLGPVVSGSDRTMNRPADLAVTAEGFLVVSDTGNDRVIVCRVLYDEAQSDKVPPDVSDISPE